MLKPIKKQEVDFDVKEGESFNYYWEIIPTKLSAFRTDEGRNNARKWGRAEKKSTKANAVSKENQIKDSKLCIFL